MPDSWSLIPRKRSDQLIGQPLPPGPGLAMPGTAPEDQLEGTVVLNPDNPEAPMGIAGNQSNVLSGATAPPAAPPEGEVQSNSWSPYDLTIPEVQEHVEKNPGEAQSVLDQESGPSGKQRVTLMGWLQDFIASGT